MAEQSPHTPHTEPNHSQLPEDSFEYELLVGHRRTDGTYKTDEQLRMEYIQLTDKLVHAMTDGVGVVDRETGEHRTEKPDVVVWLDKSSRPLAWLTSELWDRLAPAPGSDEVPKKPDFCFVNIDRDQWVNTVDPEGVGIMNIDRVDQSVIRSLRSIFISPADKREGLTKAIDEAETFLDDKTVLIVDEVRSSGRTLNIAKKFFEKAFPETRVAGMYWMSGVALKGGAEGNADLPVWYKSDEVYGRGVGNRDPLLSEKSNSMTQRLGSWFLSTRLSQPDQQAMKLRREFRELATNPDVPVVPDFSRNDRKERMSALNDGAPFEEVRDRIREIKQHRR
jgi:hypothetical protein